MCEADDFKGLTRFCCALAACTLLRRILGAVLEAAGAAASLGLPAVATGAAA
jgi:hypothetical protein